MTGCPEARKGMNAGTNGYVELILNEVPYLDLAMGPWTFSPLDTKVRVAIGREVLC